MLAMDVLLLFSENEPVEEHHDKIANNGQSVEEVMSGLQMNCWIRCLQGVLGKVNCVAWGWDACVEGDGGNHEVPVGEGDEEAV